MIWCQQALTGTTPIGPDYPRCAILVLDCRGIICQTKEKPHWFGGAKESKRQTTEASRWLPERVGLWFLRLKQGIEWPRRAVVRCINEQANPVPWTSRQVDSPWSQVEMPEYAKNQPAGFKNAVERVAVVGVCIASNRTYTQLKKQVPGRRHLGPVAKANRDEIEKLGM